jgi:hypothetical protein
MDRAGTFEDRLLAELMPLVGSVQPATPVARPEADRRASVVRRLVGPPLRPPPRRAVALAGLMATLMAAVVVATALWPHPLSTAYAVEDQPDGSLLVTVHDLSDPAGLQQDLLDRDVSARVLVVDPAVPCTEQAHNIPAPFAVEGRPDHPNILLIRPAQVPKGATVLIGLASIPVAGSGGDGNTESSGPAGPSGTAGGPSGTGGQTGASGNPIGSGPSPATGPAGSPGPAVVYFTVIQGPAPHCFPGVVQVRLRAAD